jgi:REP element-mobilizing transposase RayT
MPRKSRIDAPGALHHLIARGIERRKIFSDDQDRHAFIDRLGLVLTETGTACYACALIPNHFHLFGKIPTTGAGPQSVVLLGYQGTRRKHDGHGRAVEDLHRCGQQGSETGC